MNVSNKDKISRLLKGIETGDPASVLVVNEAKYIQHNPQTQEGSEGLATLFKRLSRTSPKVNIVRIFEEGEFVFAHTEYDFSSRNIGFEIFRFEDGQAVEHWDNIQPRMEINEYSLSMVDGQVKVQDRDRTNANREIISLVVKQGLIKRNAKTIDDRLNRTLFKEHSPYNDKQLLNLLESFSQTTILPAKKRQGTTRQSFPIEYKKCHRILAEGNFVLSVCEGYVNQIHSSFFDLYRLEEGQIVEHWDTTEAIPPKTEWKNHNGKF